MKHYDTDVQFAKKMLLLFPDGKEHHFLIGWAEGLRCRTKSEAFIKKITGKYRNYKFSPFIERKKQYEGFLAALRKKTQDRPHGILTDLN